MGAMRALRASVAALLAVAGLTAAGCGRSAVKPEELRAWVGRPATALEKDWGPATREVPDGDLRILIYEELTKNTSKGFEGSRSVRALGPYGAAHEAAKEAYRLPTIYVRSYLFWVDPAGTIVNSTVSQP
jgi:hypothetical protein